MAHILEAPARISRKVDWFSRILVLLSGLAVLAWCVLVGMRDELRQGYPGHWLRSVPLRCGERLPRFRLATTTNAWIDTDQLRGGWALLVFSSPWCPPCAHELRALAKVSGALSGKLRIVPVAEGQSGFVSPRTAALRYARGNRLPFEMALDPEERVGPACGSRAGLPYAVLLDPSGAVRLASRGTSATRPGSSMLTEALMAFFTGSPSPSLPMTHWDRLPPAPDSAVILRSGERTRLSVLSHAGTLVMTFLTGADPREAERLEALRRSARAPHVRILLVLSGPAAKPAGLRPDDGILLTDQDTGRLFAAYGVVRGPVSVILHRGRSVAREAEPQQSGEAFEQELAYAVLLSSSGRQSQALEATPTRARPL